MDNTIRILQVPDGIRHQINTWQDLKKLEEKARQSVEALKADSTVNHAQPQIKASDDFEELLKTLGKSVDNKPTIDTCEQAAVIKAIESDEETIEDVYTVDPEPPEEVVEDTQPEAAVEETDVISPNNPTITDVETTEEEEEYIGLPQLGNKSKSKTKAKKERKQRKKEKVDNIKEKPSKVKKPLFSFFKKDKSTSMQQDNIDNEELGLPSLHDKSSLIFDTMQEVVEDEAVPEDTGDLGNDNIITAEQDDNVDDMYARSVKRQGFINVSIGGDNNE